MSIYQGLINHGGAVFSNPGQSHFCQRSYSLPILQPWVKTSFVGIASKNAIPCRPHLPCPKPVDCSPIFHDMILALKKSFFIQNIDRTTGSAVKQTRLNEATNQSCYTNSCIAKSWRAISRGLPYAPSRPLWVAWRTPYSTLFTDLFLRLLLERALFLIL